MLNYMNGYSKILFNTLFYAFELKNLLFLTTVYIIDEINFKVHVFIIFILEDEHKLNLRMLMHACKNTLINL
jgi:hypothetical protein